MTNEALEGWEETTLWFKIGINASKRQKIRVLSPPNCPDKDYVKLLEKTASQIVRLIRELIGTDEIIIQGQYQRSK